MAVYTFKQKVVEIYHIEADSEEQARDMIYSGEYASADALLEELILDSVKD
jgi:hypothetical protein